MRIIKTLFAGIIFSTHLAAHAQQLDCAKSLDQLNKIVRKSTLELENNKWLEGVYGELATDAKRNSRLSVGLFAAGGVLLTLGQGAAAISAIGTGTHVAPTYFAATSWITAPWAARTVILAPGIAGAGAGLTEAVLSMGIVDALSNGDLNVEQLLEANKEFDKLSADLIEVRNSVNLDYSQWTDFLGIRDRRTTDKLHQVSLAQVQVSEAKVKHFEASRRAVQLACNVQ